MIRRDTLDVQHEIPLSHLRGRDSGVLNDTFTVQVPAYINRQIPLWNGASDRDILTRTGWTVLEGEWNDSGKDFNNTGPINDLRFGGRINWYGEKQE